MKKFLEKVPYLIFSFFLFIILPLCSYFISNRSGMIILLLIILYPVISFLISFLYAYNKEDFSYIFSFIIGIFYIISCLIILNFDILIYGLGYIFFSLCGQGTGFLIGKLRRSKKRAKQSQLNSIKKGEVFYDLTPKSQTQDSVVVIMTATLSFLYLYSHMFYSILFRT